MISEKVYEGPSGALRALMDKFHAHLAQQAEKPPHGLCGGCERVIPATELCVTCPRCAQRICVSCLDAHPCAPTDTPWANRTHIA